MTINDKATTFTYGTAGSDIIYAQYLLGDMIDGFGGDDIIYGLEGNDTLLGGTGRDTLYGFGGNDVLDGGAGGDKLYGGNGDDLIIPDSVSTANDSIDGGDGVDTIDYGSSAATRGVIIDLRISKTQDTRGAGKDLILNIENVIGTVFGDTLSGTDNANTLTGGNGADTINAFNGHDQIDGGAGDDALYGGLGNDQFFPDTGAIGNDLIDGGDGIDTINYQRSAATSGVTVDLRLTTTQNTGGAGYDTIRNIEQIQGSNFNDTIIGSAADNWFNTGAGSDFVDGGDGNDSIFSGGGDTLGDFLKGGNGDDKIRGGMGNDNLNGEAGADSLRAGLGTDVLTGGTGGDTFIFMFGSGSGDSNITAPDQITDFNGTEDIIVLQSFEWTTNISFLGNGNFTATGVSEVRVVDDQGVQRIEVDIEGNGSGDIDMAIYVTGTPINADDFTFVSVYPF